jgi:hypothetical protein
LGELLVFCLFILMRPTGSVDVWFNDIDGYILYYTEDFYLTHLNFDSLLLRIIFCSHVLIWIFKYSTISVF